MYWHTKRIVVPGKHGGIPTAYYKRGWSPESTFGEYSVLYIRKRGLLYFLYAWFMCRVLGRDAGGYTGIKFGVPAIKIDMSGLEYFGDPRHVDDKRRKAGIAT